MSFVSRERRKRRRGRSKISKKLKKKLFGHLFMAPCCYCRRVFMVDDLTIEHVIPLILGGTHDEANIALACAPCNHQRGKEAWFHKRQLRKQYYEQHSAQYQKQDRQGAVPNS
jgi:5-methylcytosine-specific restriction protein A